MSLPRLFTPLTTVESRGLVAHIGHSPTTTTVGKENPKPKETAQRFFICVGASLASRRFSPHSLPCLPSDQILCYTTSVWQCWILSSVCGNLRAWFEFLNCRASLFFVWNRTMNNEMPSSAFNRVVSVTLVNMIRFSDCICTPSGKIFHHRLSTTLPVGSVDHAGAARARTHRQRISGLFSHVISSSGPSWKEEQKPIHSSHPVSPNKIIHSLLFPFFSFRSLLNIFYRHFWDILFGSWPFYLRNRGIFIFLIYIHHSVKMASSTWRNSGHSYLIRMD